MNDTVIREQKREIEIVSNDISNFDFHRSTMKGDKNKQTFEKRNI